MSLPNIVKANMKITNTSTFLSWIVIVTLLDLYQNGAARKPKQAPLDACAYEEYNEYKSKVRNDCRFHPIQTSKSSIKFVKGNCIIQSPQKGT